jgi:hypothetical protein
MLHLEIRQSPSEGANTPSAAFAMGRDLAMLKQKRPPRSLNVASRRSSVLRGQARKCARHRARRQQFLFWWTNERLGDLTGPSFSWHVFFVFVFFLFFLFFGNLIHGCVHFRLESDQPVNRWREYGESLARIWYIVRRCTQRFNVVCVCRHTATTLVSLQLAKYLTSYVWRGYGEPPYCVYFCS